MNVDPERKEPENSVATAGKTRTWSPFVRLGLLGIFFATLPFAWGESSSCNGPVHVYTGFEQATQHGGEAIAFFTIFLLPVILGFVQLLTRPAWVRLGLELIAAMFAGFGSFYCFISAAIGGNLFTRSSRVYLAPWVATIAIFAMMIDAFAGAITQVRAMLDARRARNDHARSKPTASG